MLKEGDRVNLVPEDSDALDYPTGTVTFVNSPEDDVDVSWDDGLQTYGHFSSELCLAPDGELVEA